MHLGAAEIEPAANMGIDDAYFGDIRFAVRYQVAIEVQILHIKQATDLGVVDRQIADDMSIAERDIGKLRLVAHHKSSIDPCQAHAEGPTYF